MLDERQRPKSDDYGCLTVVVAAAIVWGCLFGAAHGQTCALQPGNDQAARPLGQRGSTRITEAELRKADGLTIRLQPEWLWHDDGKGNFKWDFSVPDSNVALCRKLGKKYTLLLMGGGPKPLDPYNRGWYASAARELGKRYSSDPLCYAAHVTGASPTGHSEELYWGRPMPSLAKVAIKELIREWAAAFPRQWIILAGSANDQAAMRELISYLVAVAPGRGVYKMNAMSPKPNLDWAGNTLLIEAAKMGADIGYEELQPSNHPKFGGTWAQFVAKVKEIERRAGKRFVYQALYRYDLAKAGSLKSTATQAPGAVYQGNWSGGWFREEYHRNRAAYKPFEVDPAKLGGRR